MKKNKQKPGVKPEAGEARNNIVTIKFTDKELEEINKISEKIEIPRTRFIRNLILASLEDARFLNKIGALKGVKFLADFKERYFNPEKYKTLKLEE